MNIGKSGSVKARVRRLTWVLGPIALFGACTTVPVTTSPTFQPAVEVPPETRILVISPLLRFESVQTEAVLPPSEYYGQAFEQQLIAWAKKEATARAFEVAEPASPDVVPAASACEQLTAQSNKLARGIVADEAKPSLDSIASVNANYAVLVQYLRVKIGPGGSWNSYTGEITSTMSNMLIDAALVSSRDGRVLWKNEVLLRNLAMPNSKEFMQSLSLIYKTFIKK
jgi:hypothetical protein